jgi:hypothetical protein
MQEFRGKMTDYEWYGWLEEAFDKGYKQALQLQQTGVMRSCFENLENDIILG